jgi:hypothetical protein
MSWVLILNSDYVAKPPAVCGGYKTFEEAIRAGDLATAFINFKGTFGYRGSRMPFYTSYVVIPGIDEIDGQSLHCYLEIVNGPSYGTDEDGMIKRIKLGFPNPDHS